MTIATEVPERVKPPMRTSTTLPIRTVSESNAHEHWRTRQRRAKDQRSTTALVCAAELDRPKLPCVVRVIRISPRGLDRPNLDGAMKHVIDGIADFLGIDDRDPRVRYLCEQERGPMGVRIEVIAGAEAVTVIRVAQPAEGRP